MFLFDALGPINPDLPQEGYECLAQFKSRLSLPVVDLGGGNLSYFLLCLGENSSHQILNLIVKIHFSLQQFQSLQSLGLGEASQEVLKEQFYLIVDDIDLNAVIFCVYLVVLHKSLQVFVNQLHSL